MAFSPISRHTTIVDCDIMAAVVKRLGLERLWVTLLYMKRLSDYQKDRGNAL